MKRVVVVIGAIVMARAAALVLASVSQGVRVVVLGTEFPAGGDVPAGPS